MTRKPTLIFVSHGWGAPDTRVGEGPLVAFKELEPFLIRHQIPHHILNYHQNGQHPVYKKIPSDQLDFHHQQVALMMMDLANLVSHVCQSGFFPIIIGGDHSIAMGTWSGIRLSQPKRDFGLLWLDAHMDAHNFDSTSTGAPHGMPIGTLLGYGYESWSNLGGILPKLHPHQLAQIGIRSFEASEAHLLKEQHVRIYYENDVAHYGFDKIFDDAKTHITQTTPFFGISIDLDGFDPVFAPGTGIWEPKGLNPHDVLPHIQNLIKNPNCLGFEIAEFNASRDSTDQRTLKLVCDMVMAATNLM